MSVDASVKEEWGTENRDVFPIALSLKFEIIQQNRDMTHILEEQVYLNLDFRCIFSAEIKVASENEEDPPEDYLNDLNLIFYQQGNRKGSASAKKDQVKSLRIPKFELS